MNFGCAASKVAKSDWIRKPIELATKYSTLKPVSEIVFYKYVFILSRLLIYYRL